VNGKNGGMSTMVACVLRVPRNPSPGGWGAAVLSSETQTWDRKLDGGGLGLLAMWQGKEGG
jgi:hypothetical protein